MLFDQTSVIEKSSRLTNGLLNFNIRLLAISDSTVNGPPRGWLNLRTRGLPFTQWQRTFFFIQDCMLMKQAYEDINANIFLDFKGAVVSVSELSKSLN